MRGNLHVRFLGEGVAARRPPYPTAYDGSIPFTRSITTRLLGVEIGDPMLRTSLDGVT